MAARPATAPGTEALRAPVSSDVEQPRLSAAGGLAAAGIVATALVLLAASAFDLQLGLPTLLAGAATTLLVLTRSRCGVMDVVRNVSWGVLPLVAGLFVVVEALDRTGVVRALAAVLQEGAQRSAAGAAWVSGVAVATR